MKPTKENKRFWALLREARKGLEYEVEGAKLQFTEDMLAIMEQKRVSRSDLAELLGVKPARITALLRGDNNFTLETMIRICRALGVRYRHHIDPPHAETPRTEGKSETVFAPAVEAVGSSARSVVPFPAEDYRDLSPSLIDPHSTVDPRSTDEVAIAS